jgi:hypothetical protein
MSLAFKLSIDLTGHEHSHSPSAHRHIAAALLAQATQAFASNPAIMRGELTIAVPNAPIQRVGSWEFTDDETVPS